MLLVKWRPEAIVALTEIIDYIEQYNPASTASLHRSIVVATEHLSSMPYGFKQGRLAGTREMVVHPNYLVVYRVMDQVEVLTVLHTRQEYPSDTSAPFHSTLRQ
ncbi:type II toxin-antitoxin system RelE/ParE family toxin [Pseudomonas allii]|uniref:Type II toxin-antitoxin system RelE/ParE family toxin n=2 Tax=Pseudomonas allii TaxID=2740531 RepID=A0ACC6LCA7_9PSED|nr:type II toxin-antitoxin system RelE/ParE family toxin [Pseudomonas allii]MDR9875936.1 type II toxin-antitoxin system RelE/ParE family toxin [Pseudomonas allii]NWN48382.1 type II toxin-antitoxin system RelE/ParE family toxin [Pseudomonas allii]NWN64567.1 type II toxin-antitoxin system RelE/ParE family toxin [Pseudomonas allii]